LEIIPMK